MAQTASLEEKSAESSISLQDVTELAASMCPLGSQENGKKQGNGTPMSKSTSSVQDVKKSETPVKKGKIGYKPTSDSKCSKKIVPPRLNSNGTCNKCKSIKHVEEMITCNVCNISFHALCKDNGNKASADAICTKTFLREARPVINKFGVNSSRWGNFMFVCNHCAKSIRSLTASPANADPVKDVAQTDETVQIDTLSQDTNSNTNAKDMVASVSAVVTRNVQTMISSLKEDILSNVKECIAEKLHSALTISSPLSSTLARQRVPSNNSISTLCSEELPSFSTTSGDSLPSQARRSSIEFTGSENSIPNSSYADVLKDKSDSDDSLKVMRQQMTTPYSNRAGAPIQENAKTTSNEDDCILVLKASNEDVDLSKAEEQVNSMFRNVPTNSIKNSTKSRKIVMVFPSEIDKENGRKALEAHPDVKNNNMTVSDAKKMFPKITVTNIPNYLISDILSDKTLDVPGKREKLRSYIEKLFMEKNAHVQDLVSNHGRTFQIVYVNSGDNYTTVGIKVSPDMRHFLIGKQWIYIGNARCKVKDRFEIKQCFKCQRIGHISTQCKEANVVCMYCGASHLTRDCSYKQNQDRHRCTNCSHSNIEQFRNMCNTHHSGAESCPIILLERDNLRQKTEYSKNM